MSDDWLYTKAVKRIADALKKLAVASLAVGIFQDRWDAIFLGIYFLVLSIKLTPEE